jgi:hypothetical protein
MVCRFVNPEIAHKIFDQVHIETQVDMSGILEEINKHTDKPITAEDLEKGFAQNTTPTEPKLDVTEIERVG